VIVAHPDPARSVPQIRMLYRSKPLNPGFGLYLKRIVPTSVNVPFVGGATTAAERKVLVAPLQNRTPHALPPVDTPVVDTESFWDRLKLEPMIRQSAVAADVIAIVAISAKSPVFKVMVRPPSWIPDARRRPSARPRADLGWHNHSSHSIR
jgi:hypothetical protein